MQTPARLAGSSCTHRPVLGVKGWQSLPASPLLQKGRKPLVTAAASFSLSRSRKCSCNTCSRGVVCSCAASAAAVAAVPQQQRGRRHGVCRAAAGEPQRPSTSVTGGDQQPGDAWDAATRAANGISNGNGRSNGNGTANGFKATSGAVPPPPPPPPPPPQPPIGGGPENTDWGWDAGRQNWDGTDGLTAAQRAAIAADYDAFLAKQRAAQDPPRDTWLTPLLDWQSITGAFDPDQRRTEDAMTDEALTNKGESRQALGFVARLIAIPLVTGALVGRALADPILSFVLDRNPDAFSMTGRQEVEGAAEVHQEEARVRMLMAIGQAPPLNEVQMMQHLREFAQEVQEEERHHNEHGMTTLVCDSVSAMVALALWTRDADGRGALGSTFGRLFEGLSDIAKAVLIILVADTMLGYHSEEGWTGLIDIVLGHYGVEVEEEDIVLFVGVIPIAIDVAFKYWIFIGLNKISPGAVVTIKQLDRH